MTTRNRPPPACDHGLNFYEDASSKKQGFTAYCVTCMRETGWYETKHLAIMAYRGGQHHKPEPFGGAPPEVFTNALKSIPPSSDGPPYDEEGKGR